jgi:hypothetical protein
MTDNPYRDEPWHPITDPVQLKYLGKLGEEVCEGGSAIFRCIIQGIDESEPTTGKVNREWLEDEIADILAGIHLLREHFNLDTTHIEERKERKIKLLREWHDQA